MPPKKWHAELHGLCSFGAEGCPGSPADGFRVRVSGLGLRQLLRVRAFIIYN